LPRLEAQLEKFLLDGTTERSSFEPSGMSQSGEKGARSLRVSMTPALPDSSAPPSPNGVDRMDA